MFTKKLWKRGLSYLILYGDAFSRNLNTLFSVQNFSFVKVSSHTHTLGLNSQQYSLSGIILVFQGKFSSLSFLFYL